MDRNALNNEIVLCRSVVKRARVLVIRKELKKIKILKSCKNEAEKEKKFTKAQKLYSKVQVIKKLKPDEVTKFGLLNQDFVPFLKNSSKNIKNAALATLAKHDAVSKAVAKIKEKIPNWEIELPILLTRKKKIKKINQTAGKCPVSPQGEEKKNLELKQNLSDVKRKVNSKFKNNHEKTSIPLKGKKDSSKHDSPNDAVLKAHENKLTSASQGDKYCVKHETISPKKVDDPFFIEKKVIAPNLPVNTSINRESRSKIQESTHHKSYFHYPKEQFDRKQPSNPGRNIKGGITVVDSTDLHPSWAAKKVKTLIKPFQGKKIRFSDD